MSRQRWPSFKRQNFWKTSQLKWLVNRLKTIQQSVESLCIIRHQVRKPMREWRYGATHSKLGTRWRRQSALRPCQARPRLVCTDYTTENISPLTSLERLLGQPAEWRLYRRGACLNLIYWLVTSSTFWQGRMKICSRVQHSCLLAAEQCRPTGSSSYYRPLLYRRTDICRFTVLIGHSWGRSTESDTFRR
jgi:hypothetical protein